MRFVLLSFLFLGWAFYELSGGAGFEPRGVRPPDRQPQVARGSLPRTAGPGAEPARAEGAVALVAKPAIAPRKPREPAAAPDTPTRGGAERPGTAQDTRRARSSLLQGLALFPATEPGAEVASLGDIAARASARQADPPALPAASPAAPAPDMREVAGPRVNMRDGPGTIYPVIQRLNIGEQVEVLGTSGTGWLRLRTVQGRQVGWVAAALISEGNG
ncbi:MAG: SH3 domain-containing protein [Jhaorihella sp.]